jgi:O-antigen ligase
VYLFYGKSLLVSLPVAGLLMMTHRLMLQWIDGAAFFGSLALIAIQGLFFILFMAAATWLFNMEEARMLWHRIAQRATQRRKPATGNP